VAYAEASYTSDDVAHACGANPYTHTERLFLSHVVHTEEQHGARVDGCFEGAEKDAHDDEGCEGGDGSVGHENSTPGDDLEDLSKVRIDWELKETYSS